jgi:hypothetical protein
MALEQGKGGHACARRYAFWKEKRGGLHTPGWDPSGEIKGRLRERETSSQVQKASQCGCEA